jgi:predicted ATP-binding protein involved in virulence
VIKRLKATALNDKTNIDLIFHPDINLLTGRNGCGKTTILKLLWYLISGNVERIIPEITFKTIELETDTFTLKLIKESLDLQIQWTIGDKEAPLLTVSLSEEKTRESFESIDRKVNKQIIEVSGASLFFPTFRRIEGGFSIPSEDSKEFSRFGIIGRELRWSITHPLIEAMSSISDSLSVGKHKFIAAVATSDVRQFVTENYAEIGEEVNQLHSSLSQLIEKISTASAEGDANILAQIKTVAKELEEKRETIRKPIAVLEALVCEILEYKGIKLNDAIAFGDFKAAISSSKLSSGEKHMLSFLCYNAFTRNACIFIDEPEISLHPDWQRILFETLLSQNSSNQFIVATHSPFIYSRYSNKDLEIAIDKGDSDE